MKINFRLFILIMILTAGLAICCNAAGVNMMRVIREHKVTLVTTEDFDSLEKNWLDWNIGFAKKINLSDLITKKDSLPGEGDVIFIIDRSKLKNISAEITDLLPVKSSALQDNELITAVSKTANRLNKKYDNGWQMIVSAPNSKWLNFEMQRIAPKNSPLLSQNLSETGINILDKFSIKHFNVITTESPFTLDNWFNKQFDNKKEAFDLEYFNIQNSDNQPDASSDILYFLDRNKITKISDSLKEIVPSNILEWSSIPASECRYMTGIESTNLNNSYILCYPAERLLNNALSRFRSLDSIPPSIKSADYINLSKYSQITIISSVVSFDDVTQQTWETDIANRLASEITSKIGFRCENRQDIKQIMYDAIRNNQNSTANTSKLTSLLAVIDINPTAQTDYYSPQPKCITEKYPVFSEIEPVRLVEPDPERVDLFSGHHYKIVDGKRRNDPQFKRDYEDYMHDKKDFPDRHRHWESKRRDYENSRYYHQMQWARIINEVQTVKISGNIRFYNVNSIVSPTQAVLLLNQPISAQVSVDNEFKRDYVTVRGETSTPMAIELPANLDGVFDISMYSSAFKDAILRGVNLIISGAVTPLDLKK